MNEHEQSTNERIASAAREHYNVPPAATPRDEMWEVIEARLDEEAEEQVIPLRGKQAPRVDRRLGWWVGIAAALVIGLGLGRLSTGPDEAPPQVVQRPAPIEAPTTGAPARDSGERPTEDEAAPLFEDAAPGGMTAGLPEGTRPVERGRESIDTIRRDDTATVTPPAVRDHRDATLAYAAATRQHLGRSESFLTAVRSDLEMGTADAEQGPWARSLLSRTRLLMASPAASDPETRRLLEDLELMLTQIVVTTGAANADDARIVGQELEGSSLLFRLRSAADSRNTGGGRGPTATSL